MLLSSLVAVLAVDGGLVGVLGLVLRLEILHVRVPIAERVVAAHLLQSARFRIPH